MPTERRYSAAEARAIIERADRRAQSLAPRAADNLLSSAEVVETARELGIDPEQAELALREHEDDRELQGAEADLRQLAYRRLSGHAIAFSFTQAVIALFGLWSAAQRPLWLVAMTIVWLGGLLLALRSALFPHPDTLRERAKARIVRRRLRESTRDFSQAVQSGAAKLLSVSAKKLDEGVERLTKEKP